MKNSINIVKFASYRIAQSSITYLTADIAITKGVSRNTIRSMIKITVHSAQN